MRKLREKITSLFIAGAIIAISFSGMLSVSAEMAEGSTDVAYEVGSEGVVLAKNNNSVLPISAADTVSVFGRTQVDTIRGGTGSGNVSVDYMVSILEGIRNQGDISINEDLAAKYETWCEENPTGDESSGSLGNMGADASNPEMPITKDEISQAAEKSDMALIVIGRNTGEGGDHYPVEGDYYLSEDEEALVKNVTDVFDKVAVVMNIGNVMDMSWVDAYGVDSVVIGWQGGNEGGNIVADILSGKVNPSGKLVDTFAYYYNDYPASEYFSLPKGDNDPNYGGTDVFSEALYKEDIFVGYRYFETFAPNKVQYEFGFGLSYTTFEREILSCEANGSTVTVTVKVTNTGDVAGKEIVQVYYSAPQGKLSQPAIELAGYGKTDKLNPGEHQTITVTYKTADMSSYDDSGVTGNKSCYVMEAGEYKIYAGNSVKNIEQAGSYNVNNLVVTETLSEQMAVEEKDAFDRIIVGSDGNIDYEAVSTRSVDLADIIYDIPSEIDYTGDMGYKLIDVYNGDCTMEEFVAQLDNDELEYLTQGRGMDLPDWGYTVLADSGGDFVKGAAGGYGFIDKYGIPSVTTADGPAGIRVSYDDYGGFTQFPMGTMVACTWNQKLMEELGKMVGTEAASVGVDSWLAPALNIHRDPLGGRNFEYYSEDPLVSGTTAAAVTRGVQSKGIGVTLKHFAVNNEEDVRMRSNSVISERALREIYLKGFEIAVKTANPWYIMSSYNKINGSYAASNYELLTNILRKEWGFEGTVMTDWLARSDDNDAALVRAQNDLYMPGSMWGRSNMDLSVDIPAGKVTVAEAQRSVTNILHSAIKSLKFSEDNGVTDNLAYTPGDPWFTVTLGTIGIAEIDPEPGSSETSSGQDTGSEVTVDKVSSPKTGEGFSVGILFVMLAASAGFAFAAAKKNKKDNV